MSRRLYPTEPGSVAIAYSDIPSLQRRDRLARNAQDRAHKSRHDINRTHFSPTQVLLSSGSIYSREWRQRLKRGDSSNNRPAIGQSAPVVTDLSDTSTNKIFVQQVTTVVGQIEAVGLPRSQTWCCGGTHESQPENEFPSAARGLASSWHPASPDERGAFQIYVPRSNDKSHPEHNKFYISPLSSMSSMTSWYPGGSPVNPALASTHPSSNCACPDISTNTTGNSPRPSSETLPPDQHLFPRPTVRPKSSKRRSRWRVPDFLRPLDAPAVQVRVYDAPLRRDLFQRAQPGNEQTLLAASIQAQQVNANTTQVVHSRWMNNGR
ncbi:hypothetical protein LTR10_023702 [Elasticomyces elasticus]|uniref:Uncharacterized protein n=1 Tax=Exophiala sideris TaxID=1016849 RepID=A0ABR0JQU1_9EURO|nr:hypothetical protein LTR10_023702 [Elasticomyces elasticus]KAK5038330.1 hypothetical protein LTS07_001800 [Exophiala sideris]KAK5044314.1 hypothetical protein LTR13_000670 [Exophiala sideris]KAK5067814.1 hypothetical protein LTR69_001803 [Exophiala sideris]KAK5183945.1 hypothetical protein LTR44_003450 [Eurotiomycetes sp. CCFEE 6388]